METQPDQPQAQPLHPHPTSPDLGHARLTKRPQIVSGTAPRETNETQYSYETLRHSYKRCPTQHPNRIWRDHSAETKIRRLVSTTPPNPVRHRYPLLAPSRRPPSHDTEKQKNIWRDVWTKAKLSRSCADTTPGATI